MMRHYPDLDIASDWLFRRGNLIQPIRSTTQILVVTRHQYEISALVSQMSFEVETSGSIAKCQLFCQATVCSSTGVSIESTGEFLLYMRAVFRFRFCHCSVTKCQLFSQAKQTCSSTYTLHPL